MATTRISKKVRARKATVNTRLRSTKKIKNTGLRGSSVTSVKLGNGSMGPPPVIVVQGSSSSGGGGSSSSSSTSSQPSPLLAGNSRGFGPGFYPTPSQGAFAPVINLTSNPQARVTGVSATGGKGRGGGGRGEGGGASQDMTNNYPPPPPPPGAPGLLRRRPDDDGTPGGAVYIRKWGDVSPGIQTMSGGPPPSPPGAGAALRSGGSGPDGPVPMQIDEPYNGGPPPPPPPPATRIRVVDPGSSIRDPILALYKGELEAARGSQAEMIKLMAQQASDERAQSRLILTKLLDPPPQQTTSNQPPPPPDPFGGAIALQSTVQTGFEGMRDVLRGFREELTDIARQHARSSAEAQTARNIQGMLKGVKVDVKRSPDQQSIQDAVARGVSEAMSKLERGQQDAATLKGIEKMIAELSQCVQSIEKRPAPTSTQPSTTLRTPALIKGDANLYAEQQAAMEGVVKPTKTPAELWQEQFVIEEGARSSKRSKLSPSLDTSAQGGFLDDYWSTGGAAQPIKMEEDDL